MPTRRDLLAAGLAAPVLTMPGVRAIAAPAEPGGDAYRALVCVFLGGGMDAYDTLIPTDPAPHGDWRRVRGPLLLGYEKQGKPRVIDTLHPVGPDAAGASYGLPPEMPQTAAAVRAGRAAIIANIGPLQAAVTPRQLAAKSVPLPPRLFSHSHQQSYWRRLAPTEALLTGWGGRLSDHFGDQGPFAALAGSRDVGFTMGRDGPGMIVGELQPRRHFGLHDAMWGDETLAEMFLDHLGTPAEDAGALERDFARQQRAAADVSARLIDLMRSTSAGEEIAAGARRDSLAYGLAVAAKMIALRARTGVRRQVFYVHMDGFDTHQNQAARMPRVQAELDEGLARFARWLDGAGLADAVTTFTASDFGRTFVPNGSGTDHGWGGHQIVMGGAVNGGLHGAAAPPVTGHDLDAGRGRVIPSLAVEQTAVPLARWLGLPEEAVSGVFPFADRFDLDAVPLMRA